jgi:hypothetical protein
MASGATRRTGLLGDPMALFDFLRKFAFFRGRDTAGMAEEDLDFLKWIKAHRDWRARLIAYISGTSEEELDEHEICRDDRCALGHWIHGNGTRYYGDVEVFQQLKAHHADFHTSAGMVVAMYKQAGMQAARKALNQEFDLSSMRVVRSIEALERQVTGG